MEQYPIPQFIEQESRIAPFLSFRQFFYLVGAGVICFILYWTLPKFLSFSIGGFIAIIAGLMAFGRIGGEPMLNVVIGSIGFSMGSKNYTWKKKESVYPFKPIQRTQIKKIEQGPVLQAQDSQLKKTRMQVELKTK